MRISDWSSDVCSSDLRDVIGIGDNHRAGTPVAVRNIDDIDEILFLRRIVVGDAREQRAEVGRLRLHQPRLAEAPRPFLGTRLLVLDHLPDASASATPPPTFRDRTTPVSGRNHPVRVTLGGSRTLKK